MVELLVAVVILSTGVLGIVYAFTVALQGSGRTGNQTIATLLTQALVEETRAESILTEEEQSGQYEGEFDGFSWLRIIEETDNDDLYQVTATVSWRDSLAEREVTVVTLMYRDSLASGGTLIP